MTQYNEATARKRLLDVRLQNAAGQRTAL